MKQKVGILFQPKIQAASDLAKELEKAVRNLGVSVWVCSSWEEDRAKELAEGTDIMVCLGGDGTVLRAARVASPFSIPILSVNLGRVGFMTEVNPEEALTRVPDFIKGDGLVEERTMLQASLGSDDSGAWHALNDVVVARGERCRLIRVKSIVDGEVLETYKCDGVIVATATGSTGYALAAGGPVLHPESGDIMLQPVAAHLCLGTAVVLRPDAVVELEVATKHQATMSVDGQVEVPLNDGDVVTVKRSPQITRLLRARRPTFFYGTLMRKLANRG